MTPEQDKLFWEATREYAKANAALAIEREQLLVDPNRDPDVRQGRYAGLENECIHGGIW